MNLSITTEKAAASFSLFGSGEEFKVKARLTASDAEVETIRKLSLGGLEIAKVPSSFGSRFPYEAVYLAEILNRDWERKLKTKQDADSTEFIVIEACKSLKNRMQQAADSASTKNIEL